MWIHEHADWPTFKWDASKLANLLGDVRHRQGLLTGRMVGLGFELKQEANLNTLTNDVIKTSAIEGETLNPQEVRSSIAQRLGLDVAGLIPASCDVEGIVEIMLDATQNYQNPLTTERLFSWHAALFPTGRSGMHTITVGNWRSLDAGAMQVVSGPIGRESVHFEAPDAARVPGEMRRFLSWFQDDTSIDPVLKAGLAHLWFVTIHPFEDGNGRLGRAIADLALARADRTSERFYSMSSQIEAERKGYYAQLESQQRDTTDITPWLVWFLECLGRTIASAEANLERVLYKSKLWAKINQHPINQRQHHVVSRMLEDGFVGHMNTSKYAKLAKCSNDTALRDIQMLRDRHLLVQNPGQGRSTSYRLLSQNELE